MARKPKVDVPAAVDPARDVLEELSYVIHPIATEKIRDAVQVMLRALGQDAAADRWISLPTAPESV